MAEFTKPVEVPAPAASVPAPTPAEVAEDVAEEKAVIPPAPEEKPGEAAAPEKVTEGSAEKTSESADRDAVLVRVETEKRISLAKAWEENEKAKIENRSAKKLSAINSWENSKKACIEAELKMLEETFEKKKAACVEKIKNTVAAVHKEAEEKRAMVEAKKGKDLTKAEDLAAKYSVKGFNPPTVIGCFGICI